MKKTIFYFRVIIVILLITSGLSAQDKITVRFIETDEVLTNQGIGFTTLQLTDAIRKDGTLKGK